MNIETDWDQVKRVFRQSFSSSFHYSIATVDEHGKPHVTPIGSLMLGKPGHAIYFEEYPHRLPAHLASNKAVCVLAVNSSKWFWLKSLIKGRFAEPPAIRLEGEAGERRAATEREIKRWQKRLRSVKFTRGHKLIWSDMRMVREIRFTNIIPVEIGMMTSACSASD